MVVACATGLVEVERQMEMPCSTAIRLSWPDLVAQTHTGPVFLKDPRRDAVYCRWGRENLS